MVLFFYGADEFRSRRHRGKTIEAFKQKRDPEGYNTLVFDASTVKAALIVEALSTAPFMAEKKMVVIDGAVSQGDEGMGEALVTWVEKFGTREDTVVLFFDGDELEGSLFEMLKKQQYAQEFAPMTREQAIGYAIEEAQSHGVVLDPATAATIVQGITGGTRALYILISQLCAFTKGSGKTTIEPSMVPLFVGEALDDNAFHFVDALGSRDVQTAVGLMHEQWRSGKHALEILGALGWKWRVLLQARSLLDENPAIKPADAGKILGIHQFVADKSLRAVKNSSYTTIANHYKSLATIDHGIKRGDHGQARVEQFLFDVVR